MSTIIWSDDARIFRYHELNGDCKQLKNLDEAFPGRSYLAIAPALLLPDSIHEAGIVLNNTFAVKSLGDKAIILESICLPFASMEISLDSRTLAIQLWKWEEREKTTYCVYDTYSFDEPISDEIFVFNAASNSARGNETST